MTNNESTFTSQSTPPVGGFAEVDGRRLYVHREGDGGPAVVFLPGASAVGLDYHGLQQQVAEFSTAVVYDRGSSGYSDDTPHPFTAAEYATELRDLLRGQDIPGPYVLVAHSLGGGFAQRFAQLYPDDVAGLVWVDAFERDWDDYMPAELSLAAGEEMQPTREQLEQALPFMRDMIAQMLAEFPDEVRAAMVEYHTSDRWISVGMAERSMMVAMAEELKAGPGLPDVPLIALTPLAVDPSQAALMTEELLKTMHDAKVDVYDALAASVPNGEHRRMEETNHTDIVYKDADAVVQAIRDVVDRATPSDV